MSWGIASSLILWDRPTPEPYELVGVSLFTWMSESPFLLRLFAFTAAVFACFYYAGYWIAGLRWRWRFPAALASLVLYSVLFTALGYGVPVYYESTYLHYPLSAEEDLAGRRLQSKVGAMRALVDQAPSPRYPEDVENVNAMHQRGELFDPMEYFGVLTNISVRPGSMLDYVHVCSCDGFPVLYSREDGEPPYRTDEEYLNTLPPGVWPSLDTRDCRSDWSDAILVADTEEGFLEYAVLYLIGQQFYLFGHANYDDLQIITSGEKMEALLNDSGEKWFADFPIGYKLEALRLDVRPKVRMWDEMVEVQLLTFSNWGGFRGVRLDIGRQYPHVVFRTRYETNLFYECGICF